MTNVKIPNKKFIKYEYYYNLLSIKYPLTKSKKLAFIKHKYDKKEYNYKSIEKEQKSYFTR